MEIEENGGFVPFRVEPASSGEYDGGAGVHLSVCHRREAC